MCEKGGIERKEEEKKQCDSVAGGVRILLKKGQTTTRHTAAASHTKGLKRMLAAVKQIRTKRLWKTDVTAVNTRQGSEF